MLIEADVALKIVELKRERKKKLEMRNMVN
jgi:hypothetical protein